MNDMLSLKIFNPDSSLGELNLAGISADNTQLKSEQDYAKLQSVQSQPQFLDQSGTFDKAKFHQFYQDAQRDYNVLAATANNETVYSKYNIFAPVNKRNWNPEFEIIRFNNPFEQTRGLAGINELGDQKKSIEEIAQTQKVWDPKTKTWQDAPNDSFFGNFKDTRFLAQYEEDVDEKDPITGEIVHHYAGEFKLNEDGKPYYENANGRSINGKTILHLSDVFTTDGSAINSIDFLDSDDMQKSALGTLAKNTALIGSMFLPGVGPYVAGLVALQNGMQLGSVLGKMLTSVDNPTFNKLEGFARFTNLHDSKSQYSKDPEHMWSLENTINLIGDTVGQLQTQRFLFKYAPSLFKGKYGYTKEGDELLKAEKFEELSKYNAAKLGEIKDPFSSKYAQAKAELDMNNSMKAAAEVEKYMKDYYNMGGVISKAYMTGITVQDMYQEAKDAGANDISAIGLTLGYAAAEYALLSTGLGEWILPELRLAKAENKQIFKTILNPARTTFKEGIETLNKGVEKAVTREERHNIFKRAVDFGRKIANADYSILKKSAGSIAAGALGEGTEEVSEELLADAVRTIHDVVPWLRGDDKAMFNTDRIFDRYLQNFVGGFIGGGIAGLGFDGSSSAYKQYKDLENMTSEQAMQRLIYKLRNEKNAGKELRDTVRKMDWGSKNLAAFKFGEDENKNVFFDEAKTYEESQDYALKQAAFKQIDLVESVLQTIENEGGASVSDKSILDANTLKDLRFAMFQNSTAAGQLIESFNTEVMNMVKAQTNMASMNSIQGKTDDNVPDQKGEQNSKSVHDQNIQDEQKKFDIAKQNAIDILTGKRATKFMTRAIIELNPSIARSFMIATFDQFVQQTLHKRVSDLTDDEKAVQYNKYVEYCKTAKKDNLEFAEQSYLNMVKLVNQNFVPALEEAYKGFSQINALDKTLTDFYDSLKELRLGTLSPIPQLRQDPDDYVINAQATSPGSVQELATGEVQTKFRLAGLENLAIALAAQNDQVAIDYLQTMRSLDPKDESFQDKAIGAIIPFAVHGLETIVGQYTQQGWINPTTKKYIENLAKVIDAEFNTLFDAFAEPDTFFGVEDSFGTDLNELMVPFVNRAKLLLKIPELDTFDANNPTEESQTPITDAIVAYQTKIGNLRTQLSQLSNGPTMDLLDNFIVDLTGTAHTPLSKLLDNADALMSSKSLSQFTGLDFNVEAGLKQALVATELMQAYLEGARTTNAGYTETPNMLAGTALGGEGAFLSTDKLNFNTTGINKMLNDIHNQVKEQAKKAPKVSDEQKVEEEEWEDLPLLDGLVADSILQDLTLINRRIHFILDLLEINKGQKLNEQIRINVNTAYLRYKAIQKLIDVAPDDWDKEALENAQVQAMKIEQYMSKDDKLTLTDDEQYELDKAIITLEDAVYDFFNENKDKDLSELLKSTNGAGFDVYTRSEGLLTESTEVFDDVTTWWYLSQLRAVKSSDFYRTQYESLGQGNIVPLDTQLLLAKLHVANAINGDAMTEMQEALHDYIVENFKSLDYDTRVQKLTQLLGNENYAKLFSEDQVVDYIIENLEIIPKFSNITFGEGVPGAGKTVGSSKTLTQVLATHPSTKPLLDKVAVISTTPEIAKKLGESLELENAQSFDRHSFLTSISNWKAPKEKNGVTEFVKGVDYNIGKNNKLVHAYEIKADADIPSLIIIDEVSRFSDFELQLIDEFARKNGISVIAYGDFNQTQTIGGVKLDIPNLSSELGDKYKSIIKGNYLQFDAKLDRNNIMHGPKLGSTLRTANIQKTWNTAAMQSYVQEPSGPLKLRYYQGAVAGKPGTIIAGDKVYTVDNKIKVSNGNQTPVGRKYTPEILNNILADIDVMLSSLTEGEQIGYIYSDTTSDLYKALFEDDGKTLRDKYKGKIKPYYGTTAQSQEAQYFIIETDVTKSENDQAFIQDLYTSVTRSQVGSIVIAPPTFGKAGVIVNNTRTPDTVYTEEGITNESKTRYINRKKKIMTKLFEGVSLDEHHIEYIPRKKKTPNPPETNPVNPPTPPSNPSPNNPPSPSNPPASPTNPTGGLLPGPTQPDTTIDTNKIMFEENKGIVGYNHSFGPDGEQKFGFGDYTAKDSLPVVSSEWLQAIGVDPAFKYLTGITVSATGKITLDLLDENDGTFSIELPDGVEINTLTDGVLNLLNPPTDDGEDPEVDPNQGEETVIPETENPQELEAAAAATRPISVRTTVIDKGKKRVNKKKQQEEIRKSFEFAQLLFSFNSFEDYGYTINDNGEIEPKEGLDAEIAKHRIDGINGLIRIAEKYDRCRFDGRNGQVAENMLGRIASAALHGQSLNNISRQVSQILFGGQDVCRVKCDFALKCSPRLAEGKDYFDTSGKYAQYERKASEHSKFNDATDPVSQDAYRKQIVLNIELDGKPALEVPIVLLNSALSIMQMKQDGNPVYSELLSVWDPETSSLSIHEGVSAILNAFDNKDYPQYRTLMNLFRLFNFTMPGYFRLNKEFETNGKKYDLRNWTIGKDLLNLGCGIEIERGVNSINGRNVYNAEWVPIDVVLRDTRKTVSEIYTTSNAILNNNGEVIVKSGNSFVLITDDKSIPENRLWEIFKADQNKPINERTNKVSIYYVLPPKRSFGQYMMSLRDFCSQPGGHTQPIGNNMTIYKVFSGIRAVLGDTAFDSVFQNGQFSNGDQVCQNVKSILDNIKQLYDDNGGESKEATRFIQAQREGGNGESNERYLLSTLKELVWPLGINEYGGRDTSGYGIFKLDMFNLLEQAFNQSNVIIYDSSNIKQGSNGEIKPVKVQERYIGYSKPTVYTGEATNALKPGDSIFDENADDNWHIDGKISTSEFQTKENNEDFGAFLNHVIRDSLFTNRQDGQTYQKHGKYGDGDVEYYETARADVSSQPPVQNKLPERVIDILRRMNFSDEDIETLEQFDNDGDVINYINEKLIERKRPYLLIPFDSNNGIDARVIKFDQAFPGLYAVKSPENIVYDGNNIISADITLSDGSIWRATDDKTNPNTEYSQIKGPDAPNPQPAPPNPNSPAPTSYIIGSNPNVAADELMAANTLLFNNKKLNLPIKELDSEIRKFIDARRNDPERLNRIINRLNIEYKVKLLQNHFTQAQISNIEGMISEINRYAQYSPDQNDISCNTRTA